jgi:hypothetical protein
MAAVTGGDKISHGYYLPDSWLYSFDGQVGVRVQAAPACSSLSLINI